MSTTVLWFTFIACGVVTFATRSSFMALGERLPLPEAAERALRYVAPAAFAAISFPLILGGDGLDELSADVPRVLAVIAASAVILRWKNIPGSLLVGMAALWVLQAVGL